jgi:hypothetical protein
VAGTQRASRRTSRRKYCGLLSPMLNQTNIKASRGICSGASRIAGLVSLTVGLEGKVHSSLICGRCFICPQELVCLLTRLSRRFSSKQEDVRELRALLGIKFTQPWVEARSMTNQARGESMQPESAKSKLGRVKSRDSNSAGASASNVIGASWASH